MLDILFICMGCAERDAFAQNFIINCGRTTAKHVFDVNASIISGRGPCVLHNGKTCEVDKRNPHISTGGLPCQPFSSQRNYDGLSQKTSKVENHPDYHTVMSEWFEYLDARSPHSWWVEEIKRFMGKSASGESYLEVFVRGCVRRGYSVRAFLLDHKLWVKFSRPRIVGTKNKWHACPGSYTELLGVPRKAPWRS